jgi:chitin disaccharide deacetylase
MLIINADDWGRSVGETDAALRCYKGGRITSVSAMVFMEDSERAAGLAKENELDVGLHLNFTDKFTSNQQPRALANYHHKIVRFLRGNKYSQLLYNPFLRKEFVWSYEAQSEEFERLYSKPPSHVDGHHHMHLCANLLLSNVIPAGIKMRRNFSFWRGEKSLLNRIYRSLVDRWLARKYQLPDYFFDLTQCIQHKSLDRVAASAKSSNVELMTHPIVQAEEEYLMSDECRELLQRLEVGSFALVQPPPSIPCRGSADL